MTSYRVLSGSQAVAKRLKLRYHRGIELRSMQEGKSRPVRHVATPREVMEGAGVIVRRALPSSQFPYDHVDPFLLLDHFDTSDPSFSSGTAFPRHPHRGFEIITYILEGAGMHADDFGNSSVVRGGGLQKITAGRGMYHEEGPTPEHEGPMVGLQLWINLARRDKGVDPDYQALQPEEVPESKEDGVLVRVLVGEESPVRLHTPAMYLDVSIPPGELYRREVPVEFQGFAYILQGGGVYGSEGAQAKDGRLLVLGPGSSFQATASDHGTRFILVAGTPHREPVRWNGPFVD